jgi:hypothetical protein
LFRPLALAIFLCLCVSAQVGAPERKVEGNALISAHDPKVRIEVPKTAQYVGADRFALLGIADCELHLFVDANAQKHVRRLYWIQFESYLPSKPDLAHTYDSPQHTTLGGMDFYVDTWVRPTNAENTPGSDWEHVKTLIRDQGYRLPKAMMSVRLVHLLDETKRKELMIIYSEDIVSTCFSAAQLGDGGGEHGRWGTISKTLVDTAKGKLHITQ